MEENSLRKLEQCLAEGTVDLCLCSRQPYHTFEGVKLKVNPYLAVLPMGRRLTKYDRVPADKLMCDSFFMFRSWKGPDPDISWYYAEVNVAINAPFTLNSDNTVARMVEQNLGITMLPKLILDVFVNTYILKIETRPLDTPAHREFGLAIRCAQTISSAMKRFIQCTKDVLLEENI